MFSETASVILNRMINNVPSDVDTSEGSLIYDALSPASKEIAQQEIKLDQVLNRVFASTAAANGYSTELENRCAEFGLTRKMGTQATGQAIFIGSDNSLIPIDSIIQAAGGLQFKTTTAGVITGGAATVDIQAVNIGSAYNVLTNTITQIPTAISGITGVKNTNVTSGGTDVETDTALLKRLLLQVQTPATSGNSAHYKKWALEVNGIGAAQVFPLWNGNGTIKVCAVDSNMQPLSSTLLASLQTYIESQRPIGAIVTYESAIALPINISVTVVKSAAYLRDQIVTGIINSVTNYLKGIATNQNYVSYAIIGSLIMSVAGVIDYSALTINGGTTNVSVGNEQVATLGTVNVNAT